MAEHVKDQNNDNAVVLAGASHTLIAYFSDVSPTPATLTSDDILSITLTLYTGTTAVNSRDGQDVMNANGGTLAADGTLTLDLGPLDSVVVGTLAAGAKQDRIALFSWTWNDGTERTGKSQVVFEIQQIVTIA